jgi:hypothetical protein
VGRVTADGTGEDGARAAAMNEWAVWSASMALELSSCFFSFFTFVREARTPRLAHSAAPRAADFLCCGRRRGR